MILEDESPRSEGVQYATGIEQRAITNNSRKNEETEQKWKKCSVWIFLQVKVKSDVVKNKIA